MINKSKESDIGKVRAYQVLPFMLLFIYAFIKSVFVLAFPYSMGVLVLFILISFYAFLKSRKGKEDNKSKVIILSVAAFLTIVVSIYFIIFP